MISLRSVLLIDRTIYKLSLNSEPQSMTGLKCGIVNRATTHKKTLRRFGPLMK